LTYSIHPAAEIFPLLPEGELHALTESIKASGQLIPICLYEGMILDGRNRYRACDLAGVEPRFETYSGDDPLAHVISLNLTRRHLNESQRAMIAARLANMSHGGDRTSKQAADLPLATSQAEAAKLLNVSGRLLRDAKVIAVEAPDEVAAIDAGEKAVTQVMRELNHKKRLQQFQYRHAPDLLPLSIAEGRKHSLSRNHETKRWRIEIGPNRAGVELPALVAAKREEYADSFARVKELERQAEQLEKEAKRTRQIARDKEAEADAAVREELHQEHGDIFPYREKLSFQVGEEDDARLQALAADEIIAWLLAHRGAEATKVGHAYQGDVFWWEFASKSNYGPTEGWEGIGFEA
jgi:hypothetical protein